MKIFNNIFTEEVEPSFNEKLNKFRILFSQYTSFKAR